MIYWRHGRFLNDMEHNLVIGSQTLVSLLTFFCHCKAHLNDPGIVQPQHFREDGKIYPVEGREHLNETKYTVPGFDVKLPLAEYSECKYCQTVKVHNAEKQTFIHHCS